MANIRNNNASVETRRRLIEAAGEVFAEHGYKGGTIREICSRAGANGAAVNYHFRDKAELYDTVLRYAHCAAQAEYPETSLPLDLPADQRMYHFLRNYMLRVLDDGRPAWHGKLVSREMTEPTSAMHRILEKSLIPWFGLLLGIVRELIGPAADEREVEHSALSVLGQCVFYARCKVVITQVNSKIHFDRAGIDVLARHVTDFSVRSLTARRDMPAPHARPHDAAHRHHHAAVSAAANAASAR